MSERSRLVENGTCECDARTPSARRSTTSPAPAGSPGALSRGCSTATTTSAPPRSAAVQRAIAKTGYVANQPPAAWSPSAPVGGDGAVGAAGAAVRGPQLQRPAAGGHPPRSPNTTCTLVMMTSPAASGDRERVMRYLGAGTPTASLLVSAHSRRSARRGAAGRGLPAVACGAVSAGSASSRTRRPTNAKAPARWRATCVRPGPPPDRHDHRAAGHARRRLPAGRLLRRARPTGPKKLIEHGDYTRPGGEKAMHALLDAAPDLDAVFVGSDLMAAGALARAARAGRGCRTTWPSADSTTPRSPPPPIRS